MGATKKLNRFYKSQQTAKDIKMAEDHPVAKYVGELVEEIEAMHAKHPSIKADFGTQIELIRKAYETKREAQDKIKAEVIKSVIKRTEEILLKVEQDYQDKEVWLMMRHMELERDELKDIIKSKYGEETKDNQ